VRSLSLWQRTNQRTNNLPGFKRIGEAATVINMNIAACYLTSPSILVRAFTSPAVIMKVLWQLPEAGK